MAYNAGTIETRLELNATSFTSSLKKMEVSSARSSRTVERSASKLERNVNSSMRGVSNSMTSMASSVGSIKTSMSKVSASVDTATSKMQSFGNRTISSLKKIDPPVRKLVKSFSKLKLGIIGLATAAISGKLVVIFKELAKEIGTTIGKMQFVTGSAAAAKVKFEELSNTANVMGVSVRALTTSYSDFTAAARGTTMEGQNAEELFMAMSKAASVLGMTTDQTKGSFIALSQMMGGGTVRAEELFIQLNDKLPGAGRIFADSIGVSVSQMRDMMKKGELLSDEVLPKVTREMENIFSAQAKKNAKGLTAEINRNENAFNDLKKAIYDVTKVPATTFFEALTGSVNLLTKSIRALASLSKKSTSMSSGTISSGLGFAITNPVIPESIKGSEADTFVNRDQFYDPTKLTQISGDKILSVADNIEIELDDNKLTAVRTQIERAMADIASAEVSSNLTRSVHSGLENVKNELDEFYKSLGLEGDNSMLGGEALSDGIMLSLNNVARNIVSGTQTIAEAMAAAQRIISDEQESIMIKQELIADKELETAEKFKESATIAGEGSLVFSTLEIGVNSLSDALSTFITTGKVDFKQMALSMVSEMQKMIVKMYILKPLMEAFNIHVGASAPSAAGGGISAYANGGIIGEKIFGIGSKTGKKYLFGENGPEAVVPMDSSKGDNAGATLSKLDFLANQASDNVSRSFGKADYASSGSAGFDNNNKVSSNININISALDSKSVVELMRDNPSAITGPLTEALTLGDRGMTSAIRGAL